MKSYSRFLILGLYTAYVTGCSVETKSASTVKQDFPSACASNPAAPAVQALLTAVSVQDCAAALQAIPKLAELKSTQAIDADMIATGAELKTFQASLTPNNENLSSLRGLSKLESLTILSSSLTSLKGIEGLNKLTGVAIVSSKLKSIDIEGPASVTSLLIDSEALENIDNLAKFTALESLQIYTSKPLSLNALAALPKLKSVWIKTEGALDLTPLKSIKTLTDLFVYNDTLAQVSSLEGLAPLKSLTLKSSALKTIDGLAALNATKGLESLQLVGTGVSDFSEVAKIPSLKGLAAVDGKNVKIPFTAIKSGLVNLDVSGTTLDLSSNDLVGFTKLNSLHIDASNFPLAQLQAPNLSFLTTNQTARKGSDFAAFPKLQIVGAEAASLTDITGLTAKENLEFLGLANNKVQNYQALETSQKLTYADISYNSIPEGFEFPKIDALDTVIAHHNSFVSLKAFKKQLNLFELDVSFTGTNYINIDNLFTTNPGEERSLWLSLIRCQGIAVAQDHSDCSQTFSLPSGETIQIFNYQAKNISALLSSERSHIEALEKLAVSVNPVDSQSCVWIKNHVEMLNNLKNSVEQQKADLTAIFGWTNPTSAALLKSVCDSEQCSDAQLNDYYKIDITQCLTSSEIDPITRQQLSHTIKDYQELLDDDRAAGFDVDSGSAGKSGSLDYLTSNDLPGQSFLIYLRDLEIKLKLWSETSTHSQAALQDAIKGAKAALQQTLGEATVFLSKIERIENALRLRIGTLRQQLVDMIKEPTKQ